MNQRREMECPRGADVATGTLVRAGIGCHMLPIRFRAVRRGKLFEDQGRGESVLEQRFVGVDSTLEQADVTYIANTIIHRLIPTATPPPPVAATACASTPRSCWHYCALKHQAGHPGSSGSSLHQVHPEIAAPRARSRWLDAPTSAVRGQPVATLAPPHNQIPVTLSTSAHSTTSVVQSRHIPGSV